MSNERISNIVVYLHHRVRNRPMSREAPEDLEP
jgi:hypothetical protein